MNEKIDILGVKVDVTNIPEACSRIEDWIVNKKKSYVCVAPVSTVMDCQDDRKYSEIVNNAGMITPDGMPLVWIGKMRGKKSLERTYGAQLLKSTCDRGQKQRVKHFFYGSTEDTIKKLAKNLKVKYPNMEIVGTYSPPMRDKHAIESKEVLQMINEKEPDILWVGLGSPKQDYWMYNHRDKIDAPVMVGIGAAFDFLAGTKPQAPRWMQKCGLEWFFRLCCEPRRLWKRYLVGNSRFVYLMIKDAFKRKDVQKTA